MKLKNFQFERLDFKSQRIFFYSFKCMDKSLKQDFDCSGNERCLLGLCVPRGKHFTSYIY